MEVVLLGTGSADGWPNPFCACASCTAARSSGVIRGQTAALVDGSVLLDCGPEAPRAAARLGRSLAGVRHVLLTHAHPDHLGPAALLWRSWAGRAEPLTVLGPAAAVAAVRPWLGPADPVRLVPVAAGQVHRADGVEVRVLPAAHGGDGSGGAVLYDLRAPTGRLFYATDTGPLPEAAVQAARGAAYDVVLLEETFGDRVDHGTEHLDLVTFPRQVARLRAVGAVTDRTDVVAVHLSHHNPPPAVLAERLAPWGARAVPDGTVLGAPRPAGPPAPTRTLVLGGARSGKSVQAERLLAAVPRVTYVATGDRREDDAEWQARVAAHRARRPAGWATVETTDLVAVLGTADTPVLVDCLGLWLTARLDRAGAWSGGPDSAALAAVRAAVEQLVAAWRSVPVPVVAVSNEVGSGVVPATASGRLFRDELGRLNARLAGESERVLLMVAGQPVVLRDATAG